MKFGFRVPSIKKRLSARTSPKRFVRHNLGLKAPRGFGWLTNPKKAAYNRVYNRTSFGCSTMVLLFLFLFLAAFTIGSYGQTATVISENANLRGTPSASGKVVVPLKRSTELDVIKQSGPWFLVQAPEYVGWIHGNTIRMIPAESYLDMVPDRVQPVPVRRSTPSRSYIRGPRGGCYYINSNGNKTYVSRSLCS